MAVRLLGRASTPWPWCIAPHFTPTSLLDSLMATRRYLQLAAFLVLAMQVAVDCRSAEEKPQLALYRLQSTRLRQSLLARFQEL